MADIPTSLPISKTSDPSVIGPGSPRSFASSKGALGAKKSGDDAYITSYLAAVDLTSLDLDDIGDAQLGLQADRGWHVAGWLGLISLLAVAIWLPTTNFFVLSPWGELALWLTLASAVFLALWVVPSALPKNIGQLSVRGNSLWPLPVLSAQAKARALLAGALALGLLLAFVLPHEAQWTGKGFTIGWFAAVFVAVTAGILVGRFLMASADARPKREPSLPLVWPSWMRWVNLAALIATAIGLIIAGSHTQSPGTREFPLAGLGLVVGIGMAIWLASRFDELEQNAKQSDASAQQPTAAQTVDEDSLKDVDTAQLNLDNDLL